MIRMKLDHLVVSAKTLEEASSYIEETLQVKLEEGGKHEFFGTHNNLLGLADGLYLEALAIDPTAVPKVQPRWFDLDSFIGIPRLNNWVCQVDNLSESLKKMPHEVGRIISMRRGVLKWKMAVTNTGVLPYDGAFPSLIQWQSKNHPFFKLGYSGCQLKRLTIIHPDADELIDLLSFYSNNLISIEKGAESQLIAEIQTSNGPKILK